MARSAVFTGSGHPLALTSFEPPVPLGNEILVRITYCTLCRSDLHTYSGRRIEPMPTVLGHEILGRIAAFGPEASHTDFQGMGAIVGSRITWAVTAGCGECFFCRDDLPQKCEKPYKYGHVRVPLDLPLGGGLSEYILLKPGTFWFVLPDSIPDRIASPANCATATVAAILRYAGSTKNKNVLILGAGVLGVTACAMARSGEAKSVVAVDPSDSNRERALTFGATHVLAPDYERLVSQVTALTENRGADIVLELAGSAASAQASLSLARMGGVIIFAGTVSPTPPLSLDAEMVVRRMLNIRGVHNYHGIDLQNAIAFLAGPGQSYPFDSLIHSELPLERVEEAFAEAAAHPGMRVAVIP
jgi:putative phosphonate catabolism associated alcohol dehydrogenase